MSGLKKCRPRLKDNLSSDCSQKGGKQRQVSPQCTLRGLFSLPKLQEILQNARDKNGDDGDADEAANQHLGQDFTGDG